MRERGRVFGNNMLYQMKMLHLSAEQVAEQLGYTEYEVERMIDGRIILDSDEKQEIATFFDTSVGDMMNALSDEQYALAGCMECRGRFSNIDNKNKILDIFDLYCDIQEALQEI